MASKATSSEAVDPGAEAQEQDRSLHSTREENIRHRAYEIYLERGREPGHDLEDWLKQNGSSRQFSPKQPVSSASGGRDDSEQGLWLISDLQERVKEQRNA